MNPIRRRVLAKYLADSMFRALDEGMSVEDILGALVVAVDMRRKHSAHERNRRYRQELKLFYEETSALLKAAMHQVEKAGEVAKAMAADYISGGR